MFRINPTLNLDFYKLSHPYQYEEGTHLVCSNLTSRSSRLPNVNYSVFIGGRYFIQEFLIDSFNEDFFDKRKSKVVGEFERLVKHTVGDTYVSSDRIAALHELGYLPLQIDAVPEGTIVPIGVPAFRIFNTHKDFGWLTNSVETALSNKIWMCINSAMVAREYRLRFMKHYEKTGEDTSFIKWQGHDFSMRGMSGTESACISGLGHLSSFAGTDTVPAILFAEHYYGANIEHELVGSSVAATEHSVACMSSEYGHNGVADDLAYLDRILKIYPTGIVSVVADTFDYFRFINEHVRSRKEAILARDGKIVIRPDSGDPVDIICGTCREYGQGKTPEEKGTVEVLLDIFGGTRNKNGFLVLNPKIGWIYGDSITLQRQDEIIKRLEAKGISCDGVLGIGSFSYQYNTRDTLGQAMKATFGIINDKPKIIYKSPKTDSGTKKSAKGAFVVVNENGVLTLKDGLDYIPTYCRDDVLVTKFKNSLTTGHHIIDSLSNIRYRLWGDSF